ncbi:MAG: Transposase domain protein [Planctomycetaceae bacterium]|nr:Transposase domain protein [Planctomycetaceae bacterium]
MSHQDLSLAVNGVKGVCLGRALKWLLGCVNWKIKFRDDCTWTPSLLAAAAMLWAWGEQPSVKDRFSIARKITSYLFGLQWELAQSYQAFIKLLSRWTSDLIPPLQDAMRHRMQYNLPDCWGLHGFVLYAVDGSRIDLPRTASNQHAYSANRKKKGKKGKKGNEKAEKSSHSRMADSPQMWLTTLWHISTGLPWNWRTGPSDCSERSHFMEMLSSLPLQALITADAGFVGYEYWKQVIESGRHFVIRVGSNVNLLRHLGCARQSGQTVYLWPDKAARKNQPPLVLRLIVIHNGKHPVYLVTNVCSKDRLSDSQIMDIYRSRWGVELFYRSFKQTFNRRKLQSLSPDNAWLELEWSLAGLWAMALYTLIEARRVGTPTKKVSTAQMLRAFREVMREYRHPYERQAGLCQQLHTAVIDSYVRKNKASRNYPRKKKEKPAGSPIINEATPQQVKLAKEVLAMYKKGLTA